MSGAGVYRFMSYGKKGLIISVLRGVMLLVSPGHLYVWGQRVQVHVLGQKFLRISVLRGVMLLVSPGHL